MIPARRTVLRRSIPITWQAAPERRTRPSLFGTDSPGWRRPLICAVCDLPVGKSGAAKGTRFGRSQTAQVGALRQPALDAEACFATLGEGSIADQGCTLSGAVRPNWKFRVTASRMRLSRKPRCFPSSASEGMRMGTQVEVFLGPTESLRRWKDLVGIFLIQRHFGPRSGHGPERATFRAMANAAIAE